MFCCDFRNYKNPFVLYLWLLGGVTCLEQDLTINVEAGKLNCFFQKIDNGQNIELDYQVINGGHGDLDISFYMTSPTGRIIASDHKKSGENHRLTADASGDYKFCFDNSFSSFNTKTLYFDLYTYKGDGVNNWPLEDYDFENDGGSQVDQLAMKMEDIHNIVSNVKNDLTKVRHIQEMLRSVEARDRKVLEEKYFKVNAFSIFQICIMLVVGLVQVIMVKSLFDDKSKIHLIWHKLSLSN